MAETIIALKNYLIVCDKEQHFLVKLNGEKKWKHYGFCECKELGRYKFLKLKDKFKELVEQILG